MRCPVKLSVQLRSCCCSLLIPFIDRSYLKMQIEKGERVLLCLSKRKGQTATTFQLEDASLTSCFVSLDAACVVENRHSAGNNSRERTTCGDAARWAHHCCAIKMNWNCSWQEVVGRGAIVHFCAVHSMRIRSTFKRNIIAFSPQLSRFQLPERNSFCLYRTTFGGSNSPTSLASAQWVCHIHLKSPFASCHCKCRGNGVNS